MANQEAPLTRFIYYPRRINPSRVRPYIGEPKDPDMARRMLDIMRNEPYPYAFRCALRIRPKEA